MTQRLWATWRLSAEFLGLYLLMPIAIALLAPPGTMWPALLAALVSGLILLSLTPDFRWRELVRGWRRLDWRIVTLFSAATAAVSLIVAALAVPHAFLSLLRLRPGTWALVMALYPLLSALPQELVFRPLFFRRYAAIVPGGRAGIVLNALAFSLAHLLYWNWVVAAMSFAGGLVFAWAYVERRSFPLALALHAIAGNILFTSGAGALFYSGAVVRPF